jgi:hypothetical protein
VEGAVVSLDIEPLVVDPALMPLLSGVEPAPMLDPEVVVAEASVPMPLALMAARFFGDAFM